MTDKFMRTLFCSLSAIMLLIFTSCRDVKETPAIPVETVDDKYYLDAISDSMNYILLEESSIESLVGSIYGVQMDDGKLFVAHNPGSRREEDQIISVYDLDGHYLNRIGRKGRARNEFIQIKSWCLDIERNEVLILDNSSHAIKRYAYDGTYISQISLPDYQYIERIFMVGGKIYGQTLTPDDTADNLMLINDDGTFNVLLDKREIVTDNFGIGSTSGMLAADMTSFYHMRPFDRNLYKITGSTVDTCGFFDFLKVPPANILKNFTTDYTDYLMAIPAIGTQTSNYLILQLFGSSKYIYNKQTGICTCYDFHWSKMAYEPNPVGASGNIIIAKISPFNAQSALENREELISESDKPMLQTIASRENDALLFYHLK